MYYVLYVLYTMYQCINVYQCMIVQVWLDHDETWQILDLQPEAAGA